MTDPQNIREYVTDQMQQGKLTAAEANVLTIQMEGARIIRGRVPAEVRKALNAAVKSGELGHMKREGLKPEVYYNKNARAKAITLRQRAERASLESLKGVFA